MSPQTPLRAPKRGRRVLAGGTVAALTAGLLAVAPQSAQAAQTGDLVDASANWAISGLSQRFYNGFANLKVDALSGVECKDANSAATQAQVICSSLEWSGGTVTENANDTTTVAVTGSTTLWATTGNAWVTFADLQATFDETGAGAVTSLVSFGTTTGSDWSTKAPKPAGTGTRVAIVDLDPASTGTAYPFTDTTYSDTTTAGVRTWSGLKGLWAPELLTYFAGPDGIADGQGPGASTDGYVYHTAFQNQVDSSSRVRYPSPFTFAADVTAAKATPTITESTSGSLKVKVDGTGFSPTGNGIYVGISEVENFSATDAARYRGVQWIRATGIGTDGSFSSIVSLDAAAVATLDPSKSYAVYTLKAHGAAATDTSQTTETPITIDFDSLKSHLATTITADTIAPGQSATVTVAVDGATDGTVTLTGAGDARTAAVSEGKATFTIDGLAAGTYDLAASYAGATWNLVGSATGTLTVQKAVSPAIKAAGVSTTYGKGGSVVVTAPSAGKVTVAGLGWKNVTAAGPVGFAVPKTQAVGTKTYPVSFAPKDTEVLAPANVKVAVKVAKATAAKPTVKVNKKPTSKKAGKVTVRVKGISGVTAPTGKVTIRFTKGKSVKTKTVTLAKGSRTVSVPKLKKGTWKITVRYAGDSRYTPRAYVSAGKVKVTK